MKKIFLIILYVFEMIFTNSLFPQANEVKVYDCFTFFNELELLEVRLDELYDVVDHFVLVENPLTQSGNEKPLFFEENKTKFSRYLDKIIHIKGPKRVDTDAWGRENSQRNDILLGLKNAKDNDIIIISDLDEIVKGEKIKEIKNKISQINAPLRLELKMFRYFLNRRDLKVDIWRLAYVTPYKILKQLSPQHLRCEFTYQHSLVDAGWHFSDMGGIDRFIHKITSCAHQDRNIDRWKNPQKIMKWARRCKLVKIDKTYPKHVVNNLAYFKERNFIDDNLPPNWNLRVFKKRQKKLEKQNL